MKFGWVDWAKRRLAGPSVYASLGLEYSAEGVSLSLFSEQDGLWRWEQQQFFAANKWATELPDWVAEHSAQNTPCHVTLSTGLYQLRQVEKPNVKDDEVVQALKWSVPELMGTNEEQIIDCFELPVQPSSVNKVNLVATPRSLVESVIEHVSKAHLKLNTISIEELSLCDLLGVKDEPQMLISQGQGDEVCLLIVRQGKLYFTRRIRGIGQLSKLGPQMADSDVVEGLALEIQRSMDYFESQLRQPQVQKLVICLDTPHLDALKMALQQNVMARVEWLVPSFDTGSFQLLPGNIASVAAAQAGRSQLMMAQAS
ncbi:hypothetical protein HMF8227_00271 [Saliniradius amylolyticus]|uniref:MSHA biogenesis protein MshI n=1 Tax=Saliniradius amylolyticus TaxID=2183582 RepID=A0A2S2DZK2_9ALTE|nr:2-oxo acid dehydrogenase subunit E2 [Saliniradius amylolyticus]AWL10779.1 hypothetical protein HMF8227_00271 [Saliniradius amylolyticus]